MFDPSSRYSDALVKTGTYRRGDNLIRYKLRRPIPHFTQIPVAGEVIVQSRDRLDLIAARTLGNPELFWRICDANTAMNPFHLARHPGARLRIPGAGI